MQWAGFVIWLIALAAMIAEHSDKLKPLTIAEARKRLDEIEAGL